MHMDIIIVPRCSLRRRQSYVAGLVIRFCCSYGANIGNFFGNPLFRPEFCFVWKNGLFCHIKERNFVVEKIILIFVAKTGMHTLLENTI